VQTTRRNTTLITHNGGNGFLFADFRRYIDDKTVIIAMTNEPNIPAPQIAQRQIDSLFFGDGPVVVMPPTAVAVPAATREALAGTYTLDSGSTATVAASNAGLAVSSTDLALFGAVPGLTPPGGRFADLEKKSMPILEAAAAGNFRPIFEAFNDDRPFEVVQGNQQRFWAGWRSELGEFKRLELLGTASVQGDPAATIRVDFARGSKILQLIWGPRRLVGFLSLDITPVELVAESPSTWALFSFRAPALIRVTFSGGGITISKGDTTVKGKKRG
jgi:hypothetical protein